MRQELLLSQDQTVVSLGDQGQEGRDYLTGTSLVIIDKLLNWIPQETYLNKVLLAGLLQGILSRGPNTLMIPWIHWTILKQTANITQHFMSEVMSDYIICTST